MDYIQVSAKTVEDAVLEAAMKLATTREHLEYEVIEKGSTGFLGFGAKPAVIKARALSDEEIAKAEVKEEPVKEVVKQEVKKEVKKAEPVKAVKEETVEKAAEEAKAPVKKDTVLGKEISAEDFLKDVFKAMDMVVDIKVTENKEENTMDIELSGEEMGVLIGKRGQTLDSLQYLVSLVVNKYSDEYVRVKIDTENYRERRKETLENLARNIAYKVKRTRKTVSLEPMNPYERRVIHSALQNDRYVTTHSEGEEPYRRVVVTLKDNHHHRNYHKKGER
jgi:spoIIIJ-associated protein